LEAILGNAEQLSLQFISNILNEALSNTDASSFQQVIGAVAFVEEPFTPHDLEKLLNLESGEVIHVLSKLHAVTAIPIRDDDLIEPLSQSLLGYLMDSSRCQNPSLILVARTQHMHLALACFNCIGQGMEHQIQHSDGVVNYVDSIGGGEAIPIHLQYACLHWVSHLIQSPCEPTIVAAMDKFLSQHVLFWLGVLTLLKLPKKAEHSLQIAKTWPSVSICL